MNILDSTGLSYLISKIKAAFWSKSETTQVTVDSTPTASSGNLVTSGGVKAYVDNAVAPEIFWATYGTSTLAEITEAYNAGKLVLMNRGGATYLLSDLQSTYLYFSVLNRTTANYTIFNGSTWSAGQSSLQTEGNKVTSLSSSSTDSQYPSAKSVYDFVKPATASSQPAGGMLPNIRYNLGTLSGNVTIAFASPSDSSIENEYKFSFDADSTAPDITWPVSITNWVGNCLDSNGVPEIKDSLHYEVSVIGAYGIIAEF